MGEVLPANPLRAKEYQVSNYVASKWLMPDGSVLEGIPVIEASLTFFLDDSASPVLYMGWALPGSLESEAKWRICKVDTSSGVSMKYADGNINFDNIWENRVGLSYS
jgi:hypothetical protein